MNDGALLNDLLNTIIRGLVIPVIPVITTYIVSVLNKYTEEISSQLENDTLAKYTQIAENSIVTAIYTVYQIYIDDILRRNNQLTPEEINIAFNMIKDKSRKLLGNEVARELEYKYKDLDTWLENKISYYLNLDILISHDSDNTEMEGIL